MSVIGSIRPLLADDLPAVAAVHMDAFPSSVLTRLGRSAVERYYRWQLTGPHDCVALGVWTGAGLQGFLFGGTFDAALFGFLRRERRFLLARILRRPWLLADAELWPAMRLGLQSLVRPRARPADAPGQVAPEPPAPSFGVLAIAVRRDSQGSGAAQQLLDAAEEAARARGFPTMHLSVDAQNHRAIRFYERNGWGRDMEDREWRGRMRKTLGSGRGQ